MRVIFCLLLSFSVTSLVACGTGVSPVSNEVTPSDFGSRVRVLSADLDGDGLRDLVVAGDTGYNECYRATIEGEYVRVGCDDIERVLAGLGEPTPGEFLVHEVSTVSGEQLPPVLTLYDGPVVGGSGTEPVVERVIPSEASAGGVIVLTGRDLAATDGSTAVTAGGVEGEVLVAFGGLVLWRLPSTLPTGSQAVTVTRSGQVSGAAIVTVGAPPGPVVQASSPSPLVRGSLAYLAGAGFGGLQDTVQVQVSGVLAAHVQALDNFLVFRVPQAATTGNLVVLVNGVSSPVHAVTVVDAVSAPVLNSLTPSEAPPGALVRLDGTSFWVPHEFPEVTLGGQPVVVWQSTAGSIEIVVPAGAASGDVVVRRGSRVSNPLRLSVRSRLAPRVDSISPAQATAGTLVTIVGRDLYDLSGAGTTQGDGSPSGPASPGTVYFGGAPALHAWPTPSGWMSRVPAGLNPGVVGVVVEVGGTASPSFSFTAQ